jgi:hypothetical protein
VEGARAVTAAFRITLALLFAMPVIVEAQRLQPEARLDAIGPTPYSLQPGAGVILALGHYARVSAAVGYAVRPSPSLIDDRWRSDVLVRVTLDPFRQQRWGISLGGGLSFRKRTYLAAIVDLEGPEAGGLLPALQVGVSGGFRAAVALRRAVKGRR